MLKNYLLLTLRTIRRHKGHTAINILGLAVGLASFLLIFAFVASELGFDRFHEAGDQIHRVNWDYNWQETEGIGSGTPPPLAARLAEDFPEVESTVRIYPVSPMVVRTEDRFFSENRIRAVDPGFFEFFSFPLVEGNPASVLSGPGRVVLTKTTAEKYFGDISPIGESILIGEDSEFLGRAYSQQFTVTGIVEDPPANSHIEFDILTSMSSHPQVAFFDWSWIWMQVVTYVRLAPGSSVAELEAKVVDMVSVQAPAAFERVGFSFDDLIANGGRWNFVFQPLSDVYLGSSQIGNRLGSLGNRTYLSIFAIVAVFILLIACINFMNLSTARSALRAREIGVRKVLGSARRNLMGQFLVEAVLFSLFALGFALAITFIFLGPLEVLAGRRLDLNLVEPVWLPLALVGLSVVVGILAGSYPGFYLSAFKPTEVLKGKFVSTRKNLSLRNGLVVLQFSISIALIIATLVVQGQMRFFTDSDMGFDEEGVVVISNLNGRLGEQKETFRDNLIERPDVVSASLTTGAPPNWGFGDYYKAEGHGDKLFDLVSYMVDDHYVQALDLELVAGRPFDENYADSSNILLNESAVERFGWDDPIGKTITYPSRGTYTVVGVLKDFHFLNLRQPIIPFALFHEDSRSYQIPDSYVVARLKAGSIDERLAMLESEWKAVAPDAPFEYSFLDESIDAQYASERQLSKIFLIFSMLAILIASLGLFGLASFIAEQRTKEIGLRKTLGASVPSVLVLLSKDFSKWVLLANGFAWPVAWIGMNRWLETFAYRTEFGIWTLLAGAAIAFAIAVLAVSYQSARAQRRIRLMRSGTSKLARSTREQLPKSSRVV
ncbi:MAG: ABC transporter permease [Rhodothermia bacterium]|nr:MAG: ABC transporter permease [Rhodothermia bacterium]